MKSLVAVLVVALAAGTWTLHLRYPFLAEWKAFKLEHRKHYENKEENVEHLKIYLETRLAVALHNQRFARGEESCQLALNRFADLSLQEFLFTATDSHLLAQSARGKQLEIGEVAELAVESGGAGRLARPLVCTLDAAHLAFTQYAAGTYRPPCASPRTHNHAVLVVGLGRDAAGEHWVARGARGEGGLLRLARSHTDCALAFYHLSPSNITT